MSSITLKPGQPSIRKDCFQNKSKFITEYNFVQHMNIPTIYNQYKLIKIENYKQKIIKGSA